MSSNQLTVEDLARILHDTTTAFQNAKCHYETTRSFLMWSELADRFRQSKIAEVKLHLRHRAKSVEVAYENSVDLYFELGFLREPHRFSDIAVDHQMVVVLYFHILEKHRSQVILPDEPETPVS